MHELFDNYPQELTELEIVDCYQGKEMLEEKEFDIIEELLEELYPDGMEETEVNDFFWFDGDTIAQALGYEDEDDLLESRKE